MNTKAVIEERLQELSTQQNDGEKTTMKSWRRLACF
jgi:hypothetical protein